MQRKSSRSSVSEAVPADLQMEILVRMPLKSIVKFMCVSKKWASIVREKQFKDRFLLRSMTRPRLMFRFIGKETDVLIHSVYQEEEPLLLSGQQQMRITLDYDVSQSIQGLVCLHSGAKFVLCNPGTNKFLTLPEIRAPGEGAQTTSYFGYDEATDVFKVLCMTCFTYDRPSQGGRKFQVLTVGSDGESWREIRCKPRHYPATNGLCKEGVLYYGAWSGRHKSVVMSFNIVSEEFAVIDLPEGVKIQPSRITKLVNYKEDFALVNQKFDNSVVQMLVRNRVSGEWWRLSVAIPCWREVVGDMSFTFEGFIGTGELVFAPNRFFDRSFFVLYYNPVTQNLRRFMIATQVGGPRLFVRTLLDHVDSLLLM